MMRITLVSQTPQETVLQLEGWVAGEDVELLEADGYRCFQEARRLVLDVSGVKFIDTAGLALLQGWAGPRVELRGASAYLRSVLETQGLESG
jgi:anti-anti-sigma regulatory factor